MYNEILNKLKDFPEFRERRFKVKYLCKLALRSCGLEDIWNTTGKIDTIGGLAEFAQSYTSYDRIWRLVLRENPELQGADYKDKREYEEKEQIKLGYESNFRQNVLKLKQL